jgi:hypothetical protein
MKERHPEFLIWFVIISVMHFLLYQLLGLTVLNLVDGPLPLVLIICLKGLSFPLGWFLHSGDTEQLSVGMLYIIEIFNSVIWGTVIAFVVSLVKKHRSKLDAF